MIYHTKLYYWSLTYYDFLAYTSVAFVDFVVFVVFVVFSMEVVCYDIVAIKIWHEKIHIYFMRGTVYYILPCEGGSLP